MLAGGVGAAATPVASGLSYRRSIWWIQPHCWSTCAGLERVRASQRVGGTVHVQRFYWVNILNVFTQPDEGETTPHPGGWGVGGVLVHQPLRVSVLTSAAVAAPPPPAELSTMHISGLSCCC